MRLQLLGTLVVGLLVGCDGTAGLDELRDGGPEPSLVTDGGFIGDSGTVERDAGLDVDAGFEVDAGVELDAGRERDAGFETDAGVVDAGLPVADSGLPVVDAGRPDGSVRDAGVLDAGAIDAGAVLDAGQRDAGVDAGSRDAGVRDAGLFSPDASLVFLVYGDSRNESLVYQPNCEGNQEHLSLVNRMVNEPSALVLHLGDMVAGPVGRTTNWVAEGDCVGPSRTGSLRTILQPLLAKPPPPGLPLSVIPVVGNHDDETGSYPDQFNGGICDAFPNIVDLIPNHTQQPYFAGTFGLPNGGRMSDAQFRQGACSKTSHDVYPAYFYYSFNVQRSHFIVLRVNTDYSDLEEGMGSCGNAPPYNYDRCYNLHQLDWLKTDLQSASTDPSIDNLFVFVHAPLLTSSWGHAENSSHRTLDRLFFQYGVRAVFSGHNHVYERSYPQAFDSAAPEGRRDDARGVTFFTSGRGGSGPHGFNGPDPQFAVQSTDAHYLRVEVSGRSISIRAIRPNGSILDSHAW